jgi:hypothetical protein
LSEWRLSTPKRLHNPDNIPPPFKAIFGVPGNQAAGCAW